MSINLPKYQNLLIVQTTHKQPAEMYSSMYFLWRFEVFLFAHTFLSGKCLNNWFLHSLRSANLLLGSAQDCLQAAREAQLPFRDDNGSPRLPSGSQAIITSYKFGCCGNITAWQTYVQPGGGGHRNGEYDIFFQVWRPSPTVQDNGCYSLVGENRFTGITFDKDDPVSETPEPSNIISVRPGDVVGYYTFSRDDPDNMGSQGIQLETDYTDDIVWYLADFDTDSITLEATNCPLPVGDGPDSILTSLTNAGPVLSVSISK